MNIDVNDVLYYTDEEKWEYVISHVKECELVDDDEDEIYFILQNPDGDEHFESELHFSEPLEASESLNNLLQALGFVSHNY